MKFLLRFKSLLFNHNHKEKKLLKMHLFYSLLRLKKSVSRMKKYFPNSMKFSHFSTLGLTTDAADQICSTGKNI
jgi:hypothetical protein